MRDEYDVLVVGSGINGLVCATLAARKGLRVCVLERNATFGGCIRTEELTVPGFKHDTLSGFHPLFVTSPAYAALGPDLASAGLDYCNTSYPTGVALPDGNAAILSRSREENIRAFDALCIGDGVHFDKALNLIATSSTLIFGLLNGEPWSPATLRLLLAEGVRHGPNSLQRFFGESMRSARHWLDGEFGGAALKALLAPWVLHTGLSPDRAMSGFMNQLIAFTLEAAGMPVVRGGSIQLVCAFQKLIERHHGAFLANADVAKVLVRKRRATGVLLRDGRQIQANRAVVCSVTPTQLYLSLLGPENVPDALRQAARRFTYGRSGMQIHLALSSPPRWRKSILNSVMMVHLSAGHEQISQAVNEAERGLLPSDATIVVGQPSSVDPSRAPVGAAVLWIQLQELPAHVRGDAAGVLPVPADGRWSPTLKEAYADRIVERLRGHVDNLDDIVLARRVLSPEDLEALNINLVGGDPYSGDCELAQSFLWRPLVTTTRHRTHLAHLYHIGASTHPGPGLAGVSGWLVGNEL